MQGIELGTGVLSWHGRERRSDRYGTVFLMTDGDTSLSITPVRMKMDEQAAMSIVGERGKLVAEVIDPRKSTHIGDLFRGILPSIPNKGEVIELGVGEAFRQVEPALDSFSIGLKPDDGRENDWLDPAALYRAHEQLLRLTFIPIH